MLEFSVSMPRIQKYPTKKHFFTLSPTLEDALIQVKRYSEVETGIFFNKVKDLAHIVKKHLKALFPRK